MTIDKPLPQQFEMLKRFTQTWCLHSNKERVRQRATSSMDSLMEFYDCMKPHMDDIMVFLQKHPVQGLPEDVNNLVLLAKSFMDVAVAIEYFGEPDESNVFPYERVDVLLD